MTLGLIRERSAADRAKGRMWRVEIMRKAMFICAGLRQECVIIGLRLKECVGRVYACVCVS